MDRDLVLAGLLIITVGLTLHGAAPWPPRVKPRLSARHWEQAAWRALWCPIVPVVGVISVLIGVPAAYAMARRDFPLKRLVLLLFLLPVLLPPITYGIPAKVCAVTSPGNDAARSTPVQSPTRWYSWRNATPMTTSGIWSGARSNAPTSVFPGNRAQVRLRAAQMALALLRWRLMSVETPV